MAAIGSEVRHYAAETKSWHIWGEFKDFLNRGSVLELGIGIIIGGAFSGVVNSFVSDILTPPLGLILAGTNLENWFYVIKAGKHPDEQYSTPAEAQADGAVTENVGHFVTQVINFFLVGLTLFFIVMGANALNKEKDRLAKAKSDAAAAAKPTTMACNWCKQSVPITAVRCQYCTSYVNEKVPDALKNPNTANDSLINLDGTGTH